MVSRKYCGAGNKRCWSFLMSSVDRTSDIEAPMRKKKKTQLDVPASFSLPMLVHWLEAQNKFEYLLLVFL